MTSDGPQPDEGGNDATTATSFTIGAEVRARDGRCGDLARVVIDPVADTVTHLVVEPVDRRGLGRLVPVDLVEHVTDAIVLSCDATTFEALDRAEEVQFLRAPGTNDLYAPGQALYWPHYLLALGSTPPSVLAEKVPVGELVVRRGEPVHATDGDIGHVQGLVVDPDHHVTHVLLQEGHLWGRKEVAIPIGALHLTGDGIHLDLSKRQVADLPAVDARHPLG